MKKLSSFIHVYRDVFDGSAFVDDIEQTLGNSSNPLSWSPSVVGVERKVVQMRSSLICSLNDIVEVRGVQDTYLGVINGIEDCIWDYRSKYAIPLSHNPGWHINKYTIGAEYGLHIDSHQLEDRVISVVAMLNTVESGGELVFDQFDMSVPTKNGTVVIFPSCHPYSHASLPTKTGNKYSLVSWLR
jgi:hypothetical protein